MSENLCPRCGSLLAYGTVHGVCWGAQVTPTRHTSTTATWMPSPLTFSRHILEADQQLQIAEGELLELPLGRRPEAALAAVRAARAVLR